MVRDTPKNAESTAKAKLPPFVRGLLCIGTVLLVCFVVSIVLEVWYCKSAPNAAIKLAACLEEHFPHSMANAVVRAARERGITHEEMHTEVEYIVAHGIASRVGGERVVIGSHHFVFEDEKCTIPTAEQQ